MWGILHGSFVCDALALQPRWTPGHRSHTWTENEKNIKTMQKVQNGNYFRPMRPTLKTLLLMESKQLLCVELLSTPATHIDLRKRVGLRKMVKEHWYKKAHPTSPNFGNCVLFEFGWLGITFKCERTLWVRACMARPSSSSQSCKMTSGRSFPQNITLCTRNPVLATYFQHKYLTLPHSGHSGP